MFLALGVDLSCQKCREADGAAGLDHQLQFAEREADRRRRLRRRVAVTPCDSNWLLMAKVSFARASAPSARRRWCGPRRDAPRACRHAMRDRDRHRLRARRRPPAFCGNRALTAVATPAIRAAAGRRRNHDIRRQAERRHVLGDLAPQRALARDHEGIVIGTHQSSIAPARDCRARSPRGPRGSRS